MKPQTKHQLETRRILKSARVAIRLKHALMCDEELCKRMPVIAKQIEDALLRGKALKFSVSELLEDATK